MVYEFFVNGFEEIEAITPLDILNRAGVEVYTVGVFDTKVTGAHNLPIKTNISIDTVDLSKAEMIILPGGPGHVNYEKSEKLFDIIKYCVENDIYVASICAAPSVLGKCGYLKGKNATCFPGYEEYLLGANVINEKVVVDGKFITAKGAGASSEFAFTLVDLLVGADCSKKLLESMQY